MSDKPADTTPPSADKDKTELDETELEKVAGGFHAIPASVYQRPGGKLE